ncbi:MAG: hypothetical protein ACR2KK_18785 [Acidimicrobiales bacterium]
MAAVSVFVDDAVRGRLPRVCAKSGEPAELVIQVRQPVGRNQGFGNPLWLLMLLGPPGWLLLLAIAVLSPGPEYLTVRIPETDASYQHQKQLERFRLAAVILGLLAILYGIVRPGFFPALWLAIGATLLAAAAALHVMVWRQSIGISLDASRRWVTLSGVHERFVWAVQADEAAGRLNSHR